MLYDAHIHFIPPELAAHSSFYKGIWADKEKLYRFLDRYNINRALLVYPTTDAHLKLKSRKQVCEIYNDAVEIIMKENAKIISAGILDIDNPQTIHSQIKQLNSRGFRALNLASSYAGQFMADRLKLLLEAAEEYNFLIFVHPQTINPIGFERVRDPLLMPVLEYSFDISMFLGLLMMEGIFERFNVQFIFSSLGGVIPFLKSRLDRVYGMLRVRQMVKDLGKTPSEILSRVYVDTSGGDLKNIELALELFGEDKVLWGSDYPVNSDIESNLEMLDALGGAVKAKITANNFSRLFPDMKDRGCNE